METDPDKVKVMREQLVKQNLKSLRGFLSLTGYYRQFVKDYGVLARRLTNLLKRRGFQLE